MLTLPRPRRVSRRAWHGVGFMTVNALIWGAISAVIKNLNANPLPAVSLLSLTFGTGLVSFAVLRGQKLVEMIAAVTWQRLLIMGVGEGAHTTLFYVALKNAPIGPTMAIYGTAPVILIVAGLIRRHRSPSRRAVLALLCVLAAVSLYVFDGTRNDAQGNVWLGLAAALTAAVITAGLLRMMPGLADSTPSAGGVGLVILTTGLLMAPFLIWFHPTWHQAGVLSLLGLSAIPAGMVLFLAVTRLHPSTVGTINLSQPVWASLVAWGAYQDRPSLIQVATMALVIGGVYLEISDKVSHSDTNRPRRAVQ